jgi:hypothetical protein
MSERRKSGRLLRAARALKGTLAQKRSDADDTGAALILALVFLVVAALTLTALVTFAGTGLLDAAGFTSQRGLQYGANGAVEIAIQRIRYMSVPSTAATGYFQSLQDCLGTSPTTSVQLTEFQVSAHYRVYCKGTMVSLAPIFSHTATITGATVRTSKLFTANSQSYLGYGLTVVGTTRVGTVIKETTATHWVELTSPVTSGKTIELFAPFQRLVTFYSCRATSVTTCKFVTTQTVRTMTPKSVLVKAVVGFGDRVSTGADLCESTTTSACGKSFVVAQWTVISADH